MARILHLQAGRSLISKPESQGSAAAGPEGYPEDKESSGPNVCQKSHSRWEIRDLFFFF